MRIPTRVGSPNSWSMKPTVRPKQPDTNCWARAKTEVETILHTAGVAHPLHYPSMYQDLTKGRPTEVDYINGYIAKVGREHGYECKLHEFLTREVHLAEQAFAIHNPGIVAQAKANVEASKPVTE